MRALIVTLFAALLATAAGAQIVIPPLVHTYVEPWDEMAQPRAVGLPNLVDGAYDPSAYADVTVTILDDNYQPLPGLFVEVLLEPPCAFGPGNPICVCDDADLTGYTNEDGQVELNIALGGCCDDINAVEIRASGVTVYLIDQIVSPDWDQDEGDCGVQLVDFITFAGGFQHGISGCTDLTGDGFTSLPDFIVFSDGWMRSCTPR